MQSKNIIQIYKWQSLITIFLFKNTESSADCVNQQESTLDMSSHWHIIAIMPTLLTANGVRGCDIVATNLEIVRASILKLGKCFLSAIGDSCPWLCLPTKISVYIGTLQTDYLLIYKSCPSQDLVQQNILKLLWTTIAQDPAQNTWSLCENAC